MQESARHDEITGYANKDERLVKQLRCDKKWPVCLFDFTLGRTLHDFFVYKVRPPSHTDARNGA